MSQRAAFRTAAIILVAVSLTGCPHLRPNWFSPGPSEVQRIRAIQHDPYPDQQAAPAIIGGRPRDYQNSVAEPGRQQPYPNGGIPVVPQPGF